METVEIANARDIGFDAIHPDWHSAWGSSIKPDHVRDAIMGSSRFSKRLMRQMLHSVSGSERVGSPELRYLNDDDRDVFSQLTEAPRNLINMVGLVWYANVFATAIHKEQIAVLSEIVNIGALKNAVRLRHLAPPGVVDPIDPEQIPTLINNHGTRCLMSWSTKMPVGVKARVDLLMPRKFADEFPLSADHTTYGTRILYGVAELMGAMNNEASHG